MSRREATDEELAVLLATHLTGVDGFTAAQRRTLLRAALSVAAAIEVGDEAADRVLGAPWWPYRLEVAATAFNAAARRLLGWRPEMPPVAIAWTGRQTGAGGLRRAEVRPCLDANLAPVGDLAQVPGLGRVSAARIVATRPHRSLGTVRRAAGVRASAWERAAPMLTVRADGAPGQPDWGLAVPGVRELCAAVAAGRLRLPALPPSANGTATAVAVMARCAELVTAHRRRPPLWSPSDDRLALGARGLEARAGLGHPAAGVAPVRGGAYAQLVLDLFDRATTAITVTMFFIARTGPVLRLIDALAAARDRDVAVRCLIADSLPGDVRGAALVNDSGVAELRRMGVPVRTYWPEIALHEKTVVVDGRHVVVGSHNWTVSSLYRHDETSLYVDSVSLGAALGERFERCWMMLDGRADRRRIPLAALELLPAEAVDRLAADGVVFGRDLPADDTTLAALASATDLRRADLTLVRTVARLMADLRVSELTAACLAVSGFETGAAVRAAPVEVVRRAVETPRRLPPVLARRPVNPAIADVLAGAG